MTSPVDTSVKFFHSRMSGAPVLNGVAGSLIGVLSACLVVGFDVKAATSLTVASGVATLAYSGSHSGEEASVILLSGVTGGPTGWAGMNGEQKLTGKPTASSVTFATALPDGTYTGTISFKMAPLGFVEPFTGTNKRVFKSGDIASTGMLLRVDDSATTLARVIGYESMSDVDTGLGPFPTTAQISGGGYWPKSSAASATANDWALFGDSRMFYISIQPGSNAGSTFSIGSLRGFGDPISVRLSGDPYFCALSYSTITNPVSMIDGDFARGDVAQMAAPRNYLGVGGSQRMLSYGYLHTTFAGASGAQADLGAFPNPIDGGLFLSKRYLRPEGNVVAVRGDLPGFYTVPQSNVLDTFRFLDVVQGAGALVGRRLRWVPGGTVTGFTTALVSNNHGLVAVDMTGPWR